MTPGKINLTEDQVDDLIKRIEDGTLTNEDRNILSEVLRAVSWLNLAVQEKNTSIKRLLKQIFGYKTESSRNLKKNSNDASVSEKDDNKDPVKGHGRNGVDAYKNATTEHVSHNNLKAGSSCPECKTGKLYTLKNPGKFIKIMGSPPLKATIYELEKLRCSSCQALFTAKLPEGVGEEKYDDEAKTIITLLKYGNGFPFHRLDKFQNSMGVPMPASTQWDIVENTGNHIFPLYGQLKQLAANGDIIHNDDTGAKILKLCREDDERTGVFTTGIVSKCEDFEISLYLTGIKHAGENLDALLKLRDPDLNEPIQMCDALSSNVPKEFKTILCNCLSHARRNFTDIYEMFPEKCEYVIDVLKKIYENDAFTKKEKMSPKERLQYHKNESAQLMENLYDWLKTQLDEKKVEPNSSMGKAINYMINHWPQLTKFLRVLKAPLDNNVCERALKKAILNRKNSYFFKSEFGALLGSMHMSVIETCIKNGANPYDYYVQILKHRKAVSKHPEKWLPWNYLQSVAFSK